MKTEGRMHQSLLPTHDTFGSTGQFQSHTPTSWHVGRFSTQWYQLHMAHFWANVNAS